jgi:hypothetical protein
LRNHAAYVTSALLGLGGLALVSRLPLAVGQWALVLVVLLYGALVARIVVGDARGVESAVQWGGMVNVIAILVFVAVAVMSVALGAPRRPARLSTEGVVR